MAPAFLRSAARRTVASQVTGFLPSPTRASVPDDIAHLMVQEGRRAEGNLDLLAVARYPDIRERLDRRFRLAFRGAEAGEVVMADQRQRRLVHRTGVERPADLPRLAGVEGERRAPVDDAVAVAPLDGGEAGVEAFIHLLGVGHRNGPGLQVVVQRLLDPEGLGLARDVDMRDLGQRVDARIGPPGGVGNDLLAAELLDRLFDALLDREAVLLALPADERPAIVFQRQLETAAGS